MIRMILQIEKTDLVPESEGENNVSFCNIRKRRHRKVHGYHRPVLRLCGNGAARAAGGCDPKADSTLYLHGGQRIDTMLDVLRQKRDSAELADLVHVGYKDIVCAEAGGPTPGLGCAGRGIAAAFEALEARDAFDIIQPDVVLYDVLGDVVCGGFAMPIREGYAHRVYIVTSGENMAIYAAANIAMAVENFRERGYASLGGLILNRRDVPDERAKVETLAADIHTDIAADLPRENAISDAEVQGLPVFETAPNSD